MRPDTDDATVPETEPGTGEAQDAAPAEPPVASGPGPADPPATPAAPVDPPPPSVADGVRHSLDPRFVSVQRMTRWITTTVLAAGLAPFVLVYLFLSLPRLGLFALAPAAGWVLLVVLLIWWSHFWPAIAFRHASYVVDAQGIEMRRGVLWRRIVNVPRSRVQHTDVSQGPIERSQELGTLVIYTAGTEHARVSQAGLPHARALAIRDHLLPGRSDDAV